MDHPDAPIIKSGSQHAVQIGEGSKNAKSVRHVVVSDEAKPIQDRFVQGQEGEASAPAERWAHDQPAEQADRWAQGQDPAAPSGTRVPAPEEGATGARRIVLEADNPEGRAPEGPVIAQRERAAEDGRAAKAPALADHRAQAPTTAPTQDRFLAVSAQADQARSLLELAGAAPLGPEVAPPQAPASSAPNAPEASPASAASAPAGPSALMARLKAIRSHMSVTETRLDNFEPPSKP